MCCIPLLSGVKATYLLAVSFLEIIRFSCGGGLLSSSNTSGSAFSCVFEYLLTPNLMPAVFQCLTAIVHRAFETAVAWLVFSKLLEGCFFYCQHQVYFFFSKLMKYMSYVLHKYDLHCMWILLRSSQYSCTIFFMHQIITNFFPVKSISYGAYILNLYGTLNQLFQ